MRAPRLALRCVAFSRDTLWAEIRKASGSVTDMSLADVPDQVRYLASYLSHPEARASTLLIETPYVDRHYIEEYSGYYATSLRPPPSHAARIHVFKQKLTTSQFGERVARAARGDYEAVRVGLQDGYLGFIVVRPIASVPIGRTILKPYGTNQGRNYGPPTAPHRVHIAGIDLHVEGVPFQQQDRAVGACATTAVWSALARVTRADGGRASTTLAVTTAANKHLLTGRPFPASSGLDLAQMLGAIREFGYSPHVLKPTDQPELFQALLGCYVASGIPVILQVKPEHDELHAITITGFSSDPTHPLLSKALTASHALKAAPMSKLYAHDDRLGPYARMKFAASPTKGRGRRKAGEGLPAIVGWPYEPGFEKFEVESKIWTAIVPLYPKIRLSAEDLVLVAGKALPLMKAVAGPDRRDGVQVELRFALAGQYLRGLLSRGLDSKRTRRFCTRSFFSRYIGIARFNVGQEWLADVICDTTEIQRDLEPWAPVIAFVAKEPAHATTLKEFDTRFKLGTLIA